MCAASMIYDHFADKWGHIQVPAQPFSYPYVPPISAEEINEFRKLLERARKWDKEHNQPDCEIEEKRAKVKELADKLGVVIDFV